MTEYLPALVSDSYNITSDSGFRAYLRKINSIPSLTEEEEFMLARSYLENKDKEAAHKLILSHLKLVAKMALTYKHYGLPISEMMSEGVLGVFNALEKFNPDLGYRFSTYSRWWIKAYMQEYILKFWSIVKIGTSADERKLFFNLRRLKQKIEVANEGNVTNDDYDDIAEQMGIKKSKVIEINKRLSNSDVSLNTKLNQEGDSELIEFLPSTSPNAHNIIEAKQEEQIKKELLYKAISSLKEREAYIFKSRNLTKPPKTLEVLSVEFSISKERVRQIEAKAFEKVQMYIMQNYPEGRQKNI